MPDRVDGFVSENAGREAQAIGTANFLGQPPENIQGPVWAVIGNEGDSQCYLGVEEKVSAIQAVLARRIIEQQLRSRLIPPNFVGGVSDGQLNGTPPGCVFLSSAANCRMMASRFTSVQVMCRLQSL